MRRVLVCAAGVGMLACSPLSLAVNPNAKPTSGFYDEQTIQPNRVDFNATGISLSADRFSARVRDGYLRNFGGVIDGAFFGEFYSYGAANSKVFDIIWNDALIGGPTGTTPISGTAGFALGSRDVTIEFIPIIEGAVAGEKPVEAGITMLSQGTTAANFGTVTVRGLLDNNTNIAATRTINQTNATGDTFFGFTAPAGRYLTGLQITHQHPTVARIGFDDLGFRTAVVAPLRSSKGATFDAAAVLQAGGGYSIVDGEGEINVRNLSATERAVGILEFDIRDIPSGADIVDVLLELDLAEYSPSITPDMLSIIGYGGDGVALPADAQHAGPILATRIIENLGIMAISLDAALVESLAANHTHLGLILSENADHQMGFHTNESTFAAIKPTLTINYNADVVPEPGIGLALLGLGSIAMLRRRNSLGR